MTTLLPEAAPAAFDGPQWEPQWEMSTLRHVTLATGDDVAGPPGSIWLLVLRGAVALETAGGSRPLGAGDAVLVDGATAHRVTAIDESDVALADLRLVLPAPVVPSPLVVPGFRSRHAGVSALITMCPLRDACRPSAFVASYGGLLGAAMVASWLEDTGRADARPAGADPVVAEVMAALVRRPDQPWTIDEMARLAHLSRSALSERFRRALGRSPSEVLRDVRMQVARKLLRDPARTVTQVAFAVGYGSTAAFSRAFSAHQGVGPQEWRTMSRTRDPQ
ncbi:MAG TPA: AraC family transcriptional regulator [Pseudonocardia sp.]|nr:AraC family transcriptional regulator [Pseudonocardia sp.]